MDLNLRGARERGREGKGGNGEEVEGGIWCTQKFWRGALYGEIDQPDTLPHG